VTVLTVSNAKKAFGSVTALAGASFDLAEGELLALLGPNGAGKTTLIRAIAGRVRLDAGEIRLFGRVLDGARTPPELGIVPQDVALYPLLTASENLYAFGSLHGLSGAVLRERIDWALDRIGLADRASEPVKQFSGGMRRRLNIACGILHRPRIVLLDEPTAGVDPQSRDRIYDVLAELRSSGVSLLLTTHHLEEAEARCTRTVIIDHGRVIAAGTLSELMDQTVGRHRLVTLRMDARWRRPISLTGWRPRIDTDADDRRVLRARMRDVSTELPRLLERVGGSGRVVEDVDVRGPSLQAVFIHLTGRELRSNEHAVASPGSTSSATVSHRR
jgi:ABC-2 type transport system ATP-binding protein